MEHRSRLLPFHVPRERIEPSRPERTIGAEPFGGVPQTCGIQRAPAEPAVPLALYEAGSFEYPQVLGDRRPRHVERLRQFANGGSASGEASENRTARAVGERPKRSIESLTIGNHQVTSVAYADPGVKFSMGGKRRTSVLTRSVYSSGAR